MTGQEKATARRDAIIAKIKALLAKTLQAGATEAEALAAAAKARQLMNEFQISEGDILLNDAEVVRRQIRISPHQLARRRLFGIVADYCECRAHWLGRLENGNAFFVGLVSDTMLAEWLLDSLGTFVSNEAKLYVAQTAAANRLRLPPPLKRMLVKSFVAGAAARIADRMRAEKAASTKAAVLSDGRSLVVVKDAKVSAFLEGQDIGKVPSRTIKVFRDPFAAGVDAGERAGFHMPVDQDDLHFLQHQVA